MPTAMFDLVFQNSGSVGSLLWIDLGVIPTGSQIWIGSTTFIAIDKTTAFAVRSNTIGKSAGTDADTTALTSASCRIGITKTTDTYRKGRLLLRTCVGTGSEHLWLKVTAKGAVGSFMYTIRYTLY